MTPRQCEFFGHERGTEPHCRSPYGTCPPIEIHAFPMEPEWGNRRVTITNQFRRSEPSDYTDNPIRAEPSGYTETLGRAEPSDYNAAGRNYSLSLLN
ncbi:hypothetical protein CA85_08280 [Allorhodopirellula solitaria]|uniref:Uncharacterized protein n=1 Tax=Allorhodopirellula solitaria TaxID=2527987 RepID=A0A5C5YDY1_9BACT|nr:hypothetical protein CA85_08280 [Allorhodopirellula solitaria]